MVATSVLPGSGAGSGTEYRPSGRARRVARGVAGAMGLGSLVLANFSVIGLCFYYPALVFYPAGRTALVIFTALVYGGAGIALFFSLWLYRMAESVVTVCEEGIIYQDLTGRAFTPWENVRRHEHPGIPLLWWEGLSLYRPPEVLSSQRGQVISLVQPHWSRPEDAFIPLNPLAPFVRDERVLADLRRRAPWVFADEA